MLDTLERNSEEVLTVDDFYDGPRSGFALFGGVPHHFERVFDDVRDDYIDAYELFPVIPEVAALACESAAIYVRWREAFDQGEVDLLTHPALPDERTRYDEIETFLQANLAAYSDRRFRVTGTFVWNAGFSRHSADMAKNLRVVWENR